MATEVIADRRAAPERILRLADPALGLGRLGCRRGRGVGSSTAGRALPGGGDANVRRESGTREDIALGPHLIRVELSLDARRLGVVGAGERDQVAARGSAGLVATDVELGAGWVILGAVRGTGVVQRDDLMAKKVSARREVGRDRHTRGLPLADLELDPRAVLLDALLVDLEPLGLRRIELVAWGVPAGSHVVDDWTKLMGPRGPLEHDFVTGVGVGDQSGRG